MVKIVVIGSASIDLTVITDFRPQPGETVFGNNLIVSPGGKGANQAVAASRLGANVVFVGCVGNDSYGEQIISNLEKNKVATHHVHKLNDALSGTAHITLAGGDNSIIVIKGANDKVSPTMVDLAQEEILSADMVMLQQEIPSDTNNYVAEFCNKHNIPLLLNPAPVQYTATDTLEKVTYITPNEHEIAAIFPALSVEEALTKYENKLIVTEGAQGARFHDRKSLQRIASFPAQVVDTTGAGDTFNAALAVAVSEKKSLKEAIRFANAAASLSVRGLGAQGGMPLRYTVEELLQNA